MVEYPLVVRNSVALYQRFLMLAFLAGVATITYVALRDGPPEPHRWWPLIMMSFWASGLFGLWHVSNHETSLVRITNPGNITVVRGKAFRREEFWVARAQFWIEDDKDSDGDPYYRLMMDAPGGKLAIKEGHSRARLEELLKKTEAAASGH